MAEQIPLFDYHRRTPETGLLFRTLQENLLTHFAQLESSGIQLPSFIKDEFISFTRCGILAHGFCRVRCASCHIDKLVAFSCKKRGFCPSCTSRRMNDLAAHLVDNVIAKVPTRQWVLSLPFHMRYWLAKDSKFLNTCHRVFTKEIARYFTQHAKSNGYQNCQHGSVTYIQRFGSALNLNIHFHNLSIDGVYCEQNGSTFFVKIAPPSFAKQEEILSRVVTKINRAFSKLNICDQSPNHLSASMTFQGLSEPGSILGPGSENSVNPGGGIRLEGFSMHCGVFVPRHKRERLEKLLRYMGRGPLSQARLFEDYNGQLIYNKKKSHGRMA